MEIVSGRQQGHTIGPDRVDILNRVVDNDLMDDVLVVINDVYI